MPSGVVAVEVRRAHVEVCAEVADVVQCADGRMALRSPGSRQHRRGLCRVGRRWIGGRWIAGSQEALRRRANLTQARVLHSAFSVKMNGSMQSAHLAILTVRSAQHPTITEPVFAIYLARKLRLRVDRLVVSLATM